MEGKHEIRGSQDQQLLDSQLGQRRQSSYNDILRNEEHDIPISSGPPAHHMLMAGPFTTFDIFAFIINKMIGTGIFTAPSLVLALTDDWKVAMGLWTVGFVYTLISMFLYLAFAAVLPYSTGELVYVDEMTSYDESDRDTHHAHNLSRRILHQLGNGLFAYTVYAVLFVTIFNSGTNSLQVGRQVLIAITPLEKNPNRHLIGFIAVVVLTIVCFIHYFSARAGRAVNRYLYILKLVFLLVLLGAGAKRAVVGPKIGFPELEGSKTFSNYAQALLLVLFSFEGWENASFVAGEIPITSQNTLRNGFLSAVVVIGILYLSLNAVLVRSVDRSVRLKPKAADGYASQIFGDSTTAIQCWAIFIAVSAVGSLVGIIYTFSRVKQAIGAANILPHSSWWKQDCPEYSDCPEHGHEGHDLHKTPKGGLIMHWISTVLFIVALAGVHNTIDMVIFPGILQTYAHTLIVALIAIGLLRLRHRAKALGRSEASFRWIWASEGCAKLLIGFTFLLYASCSLFIIATYPITPASGTIRRWVVPTILLSVLVLGIMYYCLVFWAFVSKGEVGQQEHASGSHEQRYRFSFLGYAGVKLNIAKDPRFDIENNKRARRFGTRRHMRFERTTENNFLYWFFGGKVDTSPVKKVAFVWDEIKHKVFQRFSGFGRPDGSLSMGEHT